MKKKRIKKSEGEKGDCLRDICPSIIKRGSWTYLFPPRIQIGFHREWDIWLNDPQDIDFLSKKYPDLEFTLNDFAMLTVTFRRS